MFELYAKKNQLQLCKREPLTSGSVNVYRVVFGFSEDWEGLVRTAVFRAGEASASMLLEESGECTIPWEVLQKPGVRLEAGVYGTRGGTVVLPTVWADLGYICTGAAPAGELYPPTPELWRQELDRKGDGLGYTEEGKLGLWSGEKLLDAVPVGGIAGPQGPQGEQGPPGQQGEPGAVGPKGEKGDRGETGAQGPQGIPGEQGPAGETGPQGPQGDAGAPFSIAKTYPSIQAMNADYGGTDVSVGQFVMIDTGNVDDEDNAKLYVKGETAYNYITDLSGATGMTGPEGPRGLQGIAGPQGPQGQKGVQGVPGPQGPIGPTGPKGDKGDKGDVGPTGAAGATGAQGPTGPAGVGVPTGGSTGQMLVKASDSNFDTIWADQTILNRSVNIPDGGAGWYRIAKGQNVSAFVSIRHAYSIVNGANILFYYSTYPWLVPTLFVLGSRFDVNSPLTIDAIRICRDAEYMYYVDFHFSQATKETLHVSHLLCGGALPKNQPPLAKVADAPDGETIELSVPISKNTPNGYI